MLNHRADMARAVLCCCAVASKGKVTNGEAFMIVEREYAISGNDG